MQLPLCGARFSPALLHTEHSHGMHRCVQQPILPIIRTAASKPALIAPKPSEMAAGITLISFDVDGTLIESVGTRANFLHKEAFRHALKEVAGLDTSIDVIHHHGSTDPLIIIGVMEHHGISKTEALAQLPAVEAAMIEYFLAHKDDAGEGLALLPGVAQLLKQLQAMEHVRICLVTGNLEPIGWAKMESLGLLELFSKPRFGGFGTDHCSGNTAESWRDRAHFVAVAAEKCAAQINGRPITARYHVGDTPMDVQAAHEAGAVAIAVATGIYNRQQLEEFEGAVVLDDLTGPSVLSSFGL